MSLTEIASGTWRCESLVGPRNMFQYLIADGDEAIVVDTGMTATPRDVIVPGMRAAGIDPGDVRMVVVTHPDLDHQGGLAGLREVLPNAVGACGFADRMMVAEPERLLSDRYGAFEVEHGVGYPDTDKLWMRANYGAPAAVEVGLAGGETIVVGDRRLGARHAPGHSAGHRTAVQLRCGALAHVPRRGRVARAVSDLRGGRRLPGDDRHARVAGRRRAALRALADPHRRRDRRLHGREPRVRCADGLHARGAAGA